MRSRSAVSIERRAWAWRSAGAAPAASPVTVMGITFPNRVGLAAGLDKNAAHLRGLATFGFGFLEAGTVTPRAQPGNPQPRMFRLPQARALINRLGFNNDGVAALLANVARARYRGRPRHQHRQEFRHADRARRRRLRHVPARRVCACELRHGQHFIAQHQGLARPAGGRSAGCAARAAQARTGDARRAARPLRAARGEDRAGPDRRSGARASRDCWSRTQSTA